MNFTTVTALLSPVCFVSSELCHHCLYLQKLYQFKHMYCTNYYLTPTTWYASLYIVKNTSNNTLSIALCTNRISTTTSTV